MSVQSWWQKKNRRAKAITILATVLVLQVGLCFGTPKGASWLDDLVGTHLSRDPFDALGYMFFEALIAIVVFLVFLAVLIFYHRSDPKPRMISTHPENQEQSRSNEEDQRGK